MTNASILNQSMGIKKCVLLWELHQIERNVDFCWPISVMYFRSSCDWRFNCHIQVNSTTDCSQCPLYIMYVITFYYSVLLIIPYIIIQRGVAYWLTKSISVTSACMQSRQCCPFFKLTCKLGKKNIKKIIEY